MEQRDDRLPLPSEDEGDLVEEPREGMTDDFLVAQEEGVPYDPPSDRVIGPTAGVSGPDVAGVGLDPGEELGREDLIQAPEGGMARDDALTADVVAALRASDVPAGDHIRVSAAGSTVVLRGDVESVDVLDEILGIVGDVPGVEDVVDEVAIAGV
jgi:hypothetical protein